jgi:hypothetical protein
MVDFYGQVSKDLEANLAYRIDVRERAMSDPQLRGALMTACREDVLFFFNAFCWLYEPRPRIVNGTKMPPVIPFISWSHQDPVIRTIKQHLGFEDIGVEKSRGEGASWFGVLLAVHDWLFAPMTAIGLVSRNEAAVDNPEDPDSLFWKIDWELTQLPSWMVPDFKRNLQAHTLRNLHNLSTITGYAATGDVASGGRKKWFLMDELAKFPRGPDAEAMASTQHVTDSRLVVSTPKGAEGAYYDLMHEPSSMIKVVLDWKDNSTRNRGLYTIRNGRPAALDEIGNPLPEGYAKESADLLSRLRARGFKIEGVTRSPWYDHQCDRPAATPQNIAQELDRDYGGSMYRIFGAEFFTRTASDVRVPQLRGMLEYREQDLEPSFSTIDDGPLRLWTSLDARNRPPRNQFVVGADVSTGLGGSFTSNSVAEVIDLVTMEQVAEFASNSTPVADFADFCIALAKWFHDAYLIWEVNGPGSGFTPRVKSRGYANYFLRPQSMKRGRKKTKDIGWWTDDRTKELMFSELARTVTRGELRLRSEPLVQECGQYVRIAGKIEHVKAATTKDDSSKGKAHGDRVIALAVALQGARDRPLFGMTLAGERQYTPDNPPPNTPAARIKEAMDAEKRDGVWDDRTTADYTRAMA